MIAKQLLYRGFYFSLALLLSAFSLCAQHTVIVAADGTGDFRSIQEAINSLSVDAKDTRTILIKKGTYNEKLFIEKSNITFKGENANNTIITYAEGRDMFRCSNPDDWGVATMNIKGSDINLENLTIQNTYGLTARDTTIDCPSEQSMTKTKLVKKGTHQMALRTFETTRLKVSNCIFKAYGGDTVSPWNTEDGMFYFYNCIMEGWVDFYCPRGWALAEKCTFICHSPEAAIWHDGSKHESSKTVLLNCNFTGDNGFKLGRYHRDAQFYLINCSFSSNMADADIYQKEATPPNVIQWGRRVYYFNCHKEGGDYQWHKNNMPAGVGVNDITPAWAFDYKWNPRRDTLPTESFEIVTIKPTAIDSVAENMLLYQRRNGGWPKHFQDQKVNYKRTLSAADKSELRSGYADGIDATIDNEATSKEIKYLVKAYKLTKNQAYLKAAVKGIDYLLEAQYKNGGWPQYYPDFSNYRSEITYNDNAMVNVLNILQDITEGKNDFDVIDKKYIPKCTKAIQRGIDCILKTQIKQQNVLTAWCAQYDATSMQPAQARKFELVSLSGAESVGITRFLMRQNNPSEKIIAAVTAAVAWFEKVKITGYNFIDIKAPNEASGRDRVLVKEDSSVIWARFYDIKTNVPFFSGRDSQRHATVAEIENERRIGYAWYGTWPLKLLNKEYPEWKKKWLK
ncbi:pectate lyase [Ferruginibacter lapsinanis]|uniref:pectate lyase n=1 Tax=Ferruginibacter lapsinanis TaxID=563172 RepID=UPI001E5E6D00|nr:pectate lyase [Ferruginibacter lapsinanis]UEG49493.1 pectate lyase [Ferruginibacter lapsinanis]